MAHYKFHNDVQSSVLTFEQVKRLDMVIDQTVPIHGRANFPTLYVKLKELIRLVKFKLQSEHQIEIRDVRLNGGASNYVLAPENSHYNDLDLIFGIDLTNEEQFDVIRDVVLDCLKEFVPRGEHELEQASLGSYDCCGECSKRASHSASDNANHSQANQDNQPDVNLNQAVDNGGLQSEAGQQVARSLQSQHQPIQMPLTNCAIKEAYVHKMVKVNDDDRWSLISLGVQPSETTCCGQVYPCCTQSSVLSTGAQKETQNHFINRNQHQVLVTSINNNDFKFDHKKNSATDNHTNASSKHSCVTRKGESANTCNQKFSFNQRSKCNHQQFPNSIELKFVDRMRRKFEFSVDSFQIILDSLLDFYDYAAKFISGSERMPTNSDPSTISNPSLNTEMSCVQCYIESSTNSKGHFKVDYGLKPNMVNGKEFEAEHYRDKFQKHCHLHHNHSYQKHQLHENISKSLLNNSNSSIALSNSHRYYQLSLDPNNSESIPSSSGCSSSSSVVSSSSSSLSSCDEDHDLCCEVDMSSNSISSLMSSPRISSLSLNGYNASENDGKVKTDYPTECTQNNRKQGSISNLGSNEKEVESSSKKVLFGKMEMHSANSTLIDYNNCVECFKQKQRVLNTNDCDNGHGLNVTSPCAVISENFYPTVIGRSEFGNFKEALYHLEKKLIATRSPEEIRGGGLLKYCNLLVKNYKPKNTYQIRTLERYMCSRFFIDFSDLSQQQAKLESYLRNHFSDDPVLKFDYLTILHNVVQRSTVCLMNHELRLTLNMIRELAYKLTTGMRQLYVNRM